ncbi:MAG: SUMF1/EgtB/PvdO family nonheme iron enzyme [Dysgonamonadaceae bacterium]|mgnify:CR=1 FL=1|jgi:formylglycine-generating enzyme required for sulfatase activity|nr:SUMF1/EgtB/PvdO family nonheme iron enzyme [Dysgonamonadaceae bacterium]MDD3309352.1 SUMF1/EgtB/PvdO family nonheme iron enzyme [Dysgonamonadaceae bacterium]MDD3900548.1 SUMF1/EgtB/PvdO family nonheme iron enzyme [Dysgonamonadaceae bacterium]MDD4399065.1 SUMF1/EgtB/PvdO family nonheme iron enzyme [Dysgonamonadaceae bacterium]MEA5082477.1 SUMF1/EgtB/PvdO family nonheme iron enzyme [Dysgonamonadaceae bacterium]
MIRSSKSNRNSKPKKKFLQRKVFFVLAGLILGIILVASLYETSVYFSSNESCMKCHVHPHAEETWKQSVHVNNASGVTTDCVDCHLPPKNNTWKHYTAKAELGIRDVWGFLTKDAADIDWERKSELDYAVTYIPNESCVKCHQNLFPQGVTDDAVTAHLYYEENQEKLDLQCISCHLDAGHYNPNYAHGQMAGIPGASTSARVDTSLFFKQSTTVTSFNNFTEQIPGTLVTMNMIAVPGGKFSMGSSDKEPFHKPDEAPQHEVNVSPFFMAEVETTWDQYWAFYSETMSEGRTPPEVIYENNLNAMGVDAISGPTPPFGFPDQGWGAGNRPAITMTHYAAETFCQWLSEKTGKKYRLPTEAEWEYAARAGTQTPYFFSGSPKEFSDHGFLRNVFKSKTDSISSYVIYSKNSNNRTQEPSLVLANPFGFKNMLGNVMEYCADKYDPEAYKKTSGSTDPIITQGDEWVVRGGNFTSDAADVRSAARDYTKHDVWLKTDPQQPKSIWWYSDIKGIGFRVVCETDSIITN